MKERPANEAGDHSLSVAKSEEKAAWEAALTASGGGYVAVRALDRLVRAVEAVVLREAAVRASVMAPSPEPSAPRLLCRVCEAAHFDGPGTDGTVSLAEPPVADHEPVYEDEPSVSAPRAAARLRKAALKVEEGAPDGE